MSIDFKGIELSVDTWRDTEGKKNASVVYYEGKNITEVFEKLELIKDLNQTINKTL